MGVEVAFEVGVRVGIRVKFRVWVRVTVRVIIKGLLLGLSLRVRVRFKMSISRFFELLDFIGLIGGIFVLEYRKGYFPGLYCLQEKFEKCLFFTKTMN